MMGDNSLYLPLVTPGKEKRARQTAAMHAMAALFLLLYGLQYVATIQEDWMYILALMPVSLYLLFISFFRKRYFADIHVNRSFRILEAGFILMGGLHFIQEKNMPGGILYLVMAVVVLFLFYIEMRTLQDQFAIFSEKEIVIETPLRNVHIPWTQLQNVVLNHNYLTLVYKNEQFGQYEIVQDHHDEIIRFIGNRLAVS